MSSSGCYKLEVPHICGQLIEVEIKWSYRPGSYWEPPDGDTEINHPDKCPKCGISLYHDNIFEDTMNKMDETQVDRGEYEPEFDATDYDRDFDPDEPAF